MNIMFEWFLIFVFSAQKFKISPSSSTEVSDRQFAIICSEKQARVSKMVTLTTLVYTN